MRLLWGTLVLAKDVPPVEQERANQENAQCDK
jgi:hypothetical protein